MTSSGSAIENLKTLLRRQAHGEALALLDSLLPERPTDGPLHWHRACCLEALDRPDEALEAVERVVELRPEYAPAWVKRAELSAWLKADYPQFEADIRHALELDPRCARAHFALAFLLYGWRQREEAELALEQAITLAPNEPEFYLLRARWAESAAWSATEGGVVPEPERLLAALADLNYALELRPKDNRSRLRRARLNHQLHRYSAALAEYDLLLAEMAADDPMREVILDLRQRSADVATQGAAASAWPLAEPLADPVLEPLADDAVPCLTTIAPLFEVPLAEFDAADMPSAEVVAAAEALWQAGHEPAPDWVAVELGPFSADQRRYIERSWRRWAALGFESLGEFEARHRATECARPTVVRIGRSADSESLVKLARRLPAQSGHGWQRLWRRWQVVESATLESSFADGGQLITSNERRLSPLGYGAKVDRLALPATTPPAELLRRHQGRISAYRAAHPGVPLLPVTDLPTLLSLQQAAWRARRRYRRTIGYVLDEELHRLLGPHFDELAPQVRRQLDRLRASQQIPESEP